MAWLVVAIAINIHLIMTHQVASQAMADLIEIGLGVVCQLFVYGWFWFRLRHVRRVSEAS